MAVESLNHNFQIIFKMKSPILTELPAPPVNKTGWPWTTECKQIDSTMDDGKIWPKISVVTPSFNQAQFIEETIRSVLLQGYPNLEYIIMDGGSTDGSAEIIRKYGPWLSFWVSEPDNGQSDAINKGWHRSSGEILAWLNSDDTYEMGALQKTANFMLENYDIGMLYGDCNIIDENGQVTNKAPAKDFDLKSLVCNEWFIPQQSSFIRRKVIQETGDVNEELHLVMDWEYWLRIALKEFKVSYFPETLANFRQYGEAKTFDKTDVSSEEKFSVLNSLFNNDDILPKISSFKNKAYAHVHKYASSAYAYGKNVDNKKAFCHLIKSIKYKPSYLLEKKVLIMLLVFAIGRSRLKKCRNLLLTIVKS